MGTVPVILSSTRSVLKSLAIRLGKQKILTTRMSAKTVNRTRLKANMIVDRIARPEN